MSERAPETCPRCGAIYARRAGNVLVYKCDTAISDGKELTESKGCLRAQLAAVMAERDALRGQVAALKEALQRPAERYHVAGPSDVGLPVMDDKGNEYPLIAGRGTPAQPTE